MAEETNTQEIQKALPVWALSPFDEMDRKFDHNFRRGWMRLWRFEWPRFPEKKAPKVDVVDR